MTGLDRPLLLGAALLLSAAAAWFGVDRLGDERHRLAAFEAMAEAGARPRTPLMAHGISVPGADRRQAIARFETLLGSAAAGHRLLVERLEISPVDGDAPALLAADLAISGSEADIRRFVGIIEGRRPTIRFERWEIARTGAGETTVRIDARAIALWDRGA